MVPNLRLDTPLRVLMEHSVGLHSNSNVEVLLPSLEDKTGQGQLCGRGRGPERTETSA